MDDVRRLAEEEFARVTVEEWGKVCAHVKQVEEEYFSRQFILDDVAELIININGDGDNSDFGFSDDDGCELNRRFMQLHIHTALYLGKQELAFRGHDENVSSVNRGNFKELLEESTSVSPADIQEQGFTLEGALAMLEGDNDYAERVENITIFPLVNETYELTDEDSGEEETLSSNNLPGSQLQAPAEIIFQDDANHDFSSEDDVPLSELRKSLAFKPRNVVKKKQKNHHWNMLSWKKCTLYGYTLWVGTKRVEYINWFEPYQGHSTNISKTCSSYGVGGGVALEYADVLRKKWSDKKFHLFFNNFFTSIPLIEGLANKQFFATGRTVRENRLGGNPLIESKKNEKAEKRSDQNISLYRISIRGKKCYFPLIAHCIDMAIQNVCLIHPKAEGELDQFSF
ncbi:hypothetical protein ILUMI_17367 [Ignelater luminosus]|uniref:PiggyBac transposable element-derived protein domain-containing protein n=1 Tax=Ignelater luminosus TaxID=2038154 RepID=A0A8K0G545_IGNLU|nr:hypothetical protein ILUMI_17367 [Ignelater luminosus]